MLLKKGLTNLHLPLIANQQNNPSNSQKNNPSIWLVWTVLRETFGETVKNGTAERQ